MRKAAPAKDIDSYIAEQPEQVQAILEKLRQVIKKAAPKAEEVISYRMPAFSYHGILVYFAANKNHIGFYPTGSGIEAFKDELVAYAGGKGTAKFPIGKPIPWKLISKIVTFRVAQNLKKKASKTK